MKHVPLLILIVLFFSCQKEKKDTNQLKKDSPTSKKIKDNIFKIILEVKVINDDKFEVYYVDDYEEGSFNPDKRLAKFIKASNELQTIQFNLPSGILPYKFRIDVGDNINRHETLVEIKSIRLELNSEFMLIDNQLIDIFFNPNIFLVKRDNGYLRRIVDDRYDPFLLSTPLLDKKIELEL